MNEIQQLYDAGRYADGQRLNVAEGIARGGTAESGGAIKATTTSTEPAVWHVAAGSVAAADAAQERQSQPSTG